MRNVFTSFIIVLVTGVPSAAQTASEQLLLQRTAAISGEVVISADDGGGRVRGRLIEVTDSVLELQLRSGRQQFRLASVTRVDRPGDSLVNGALKGMGVASTWCVLTCAPTPHGSPDGRAYVSHLIVGGAIGAAIDRRINGNQTLYRRRPTPTIHIGVGPRRGTVTIGF